MSLDWRRYDERGTPFQLWLMRAVALRLGRWPTRLLLYPITLYFLCIAHEHRCISRHYLRRALGREPSWWHVARHFHCFAATLLDRVFFLAGRLDLFDLRFTGWKPCAPTLTPNGDAFFSAPTWAASTPCAARRRISGRAAQGPHGSGAECDDHAAARGVDPAIASTVIPLGGVDSLLPVRDALEAGQMVGLLGDRMGGSGKSVSCELLGDSVELPAGPAMLAAATGAPVVLCLALYRGGNRYDIRFEAMDSLTGLERTTRDEALSDWTRGYARRVEAQIRSAPFNWFNFYDYWSDT